MCFFTEPGIIPRNYYLYNKDLIQGNERKLIKCFESPENMQEIRNSNLNNEDIESNVKQEDENKPRIFT